jgi:muramidase (phage lysozyme)
MIDDNGLVDPVWFMGYVVDRGDGTNSGRVKVRCFGLHPTVNDNSIDKHDLPWAMCVGDSHFFSVPNVGDMVVGFFLDGRDAQHPVVIGSLRTAKLSIPSFVRAQLDENSSEPKKHGIGQNAGGDSLTGFADSALNNRVTGNAAPVVMQDPANTTLQPQQRAFLNAIAAKESGGDYTILTGGSGGEINLEGPHPGIKGTTGTTASGRYQFVVGTWKEASKKYLGVDNAAMTPENQDFLAWKLAEQRYSQYTKGGDLDSELLENGLTGNLLNTLAPTWEAFSKNQNQIIATFNDSLARIAGNTSPGLTADLEEGINQYLDASKEVVEAYGQLAIPPQMTGEQLDKTPLVAQAANRKTVKSTSFSVEEPEPPLGGSVDSSVWNTRYGGSYIELHGKSEEKEFITIAHVSGSRITMDQNGNIAIKSSGKIHVSSEDDIEETSEFRTGIHKNGYRIEVTAGGIDMISEGNINLTTKSDMNITVGKNFNLNVANSIDIAGARIAATARVDSIDLMSAQKFKMHSDSGGFSIKSVENLFLESDGQIHFKSKDDMFIQSEEGTMHVKAAESIYNETDSTYNVKAGGIIGIDGDFTYIQSGLAGAANPATDSIEAVAASVADAIAPGFAIEQTPNPNPSGVGIYTPDDVTLD